MATQRPHFHPKGKTPSQFTLEVLQQSKAKLPFAEKRDFEEQKKGLIAPMKDLKIMADAVGRIAPNKYVEAAIEEFEVDGVRMVFQNTPNTEAPGK